MPEQGYTQDIVDYQEALKLSEGKIDFWLESHQIMPCIFVEQQNVYDQNQSPQTITALLACNWDSLESCIQAGFRIKEIYNDHGMSFDENQDFFLSQRRYDADTEQRILTGYSSYIDTHNDCVCVCIDHYRIGLTGEREYLFKWYFPLVFLSAEIENFLPATAINQESADIEAAMNDAIPKHKRGMDELDLLIAKVDNDLKQNEGYVQYRVLWNGIYDRFLNTPHDVHPITGMKKPDPNDPKTWQISYETDSNEGQSIKWSAFKYRGKKVRSAQTK